MLFIKDGVVRDESRITIKTDKYVVTNPKRDMILADGWKEYTPVEQKPVETIDSQLKDMLLDTYNQRVDLSDGEALGRSLLIYNWSHYLGNSLKSMQCVAYNNKIYRVRQDISVVLENQHPSVNTAALYEVIELETSGTKEDPIPYTPPMEIFQDRYYTHGGVLYRCTRDSGQALNNALAELVGIYVDVIG